MKTKNEEMKEKVFQNFQQKQNRTKCGYFDFTIQPLCHDHAPKSQNIIVHQPLTSIDLRYLL